VTAKPPHNAIQKLNGSAEASYEQQAHAGRRGSRVDLPLEKPMSTDESEE